VNTAYQQGSPVIMKRPEECMYELEWDSPLACKSKYDKSEAVHCLFNNTVTGMEMNLQPLANQTATVSIVLSFTLIITTFFEFKVYSTLHVYTVQYYLLAIQPLVTDSSFYSALYIVLCCCLLDYSGWGSL